MFNSLTGTVTEKSPQRLCLATGGIEWDISVPESSLSALPPVGGEGRVYTWLQHTDALLVLYGFASPAERSLFFDLLKVDGVGPKGALKIMGSVGSAELAHILDEGDLSTLQKVPGVGKKTAAKMLLQLKGKLSLAAPRQEGGGDGERALPYADVADALVNMGYERKLVEQTVVRLAKELGTAGAEDELLRRAVVELAQ